MVRKETAVLNLDGEYPRALSEITLRGLAIHPASGDYVVADTPTHAGHAMRVRHPEGGAVTLRVGLLVGDAGSQHREESA